MVDGTHMRTDIDVRREEIVSWLEGGVSQRECARRLDCRIDTLRPRLRKLGVDHLKNQSGKGQSKYGCRRPIGDYLVENGPCIKTDVLKHRLWREGLKDRRCELCGITEWLDQEAPLQLDHENGHRYDNRFSNLRILCANCHQLQPTSNGKNRRYKS